MKKLILLFCLLFIVSGCSSNYSTEKKLEDNGYTCDDDVCILDYESDYGSDESNNIFASNVITKKFDFNDSYYEYFYAYSVIDNGTFPIVEKWLYDYGLETEKSFVTYYVEVPNNYFIYICGDGELTYYDGELFFPDNDPEVIYCNSYNSSEYSDLCQTGSLKCSLGYNQYLEDKVD